MHEQLPAEVRAGDGDAFGELIEPYRRELQVHCYRILGSVHDAEDLLQETLMAAWRGLDRLQDRRALRAWLYRIATNKCLNALRAGRRGPRAGFTPEADLPEPTRQNEPVWLEPYPDVLLGELPDAAPGPEARYEGIEAISLAFVTALQHLPPRQRAVLVLRDVLGFRAAETADILQWSIDAVNGTLKRARATIARHQAPGSRDAAPLAASPRERAVVARFASAFERGDVDAIVAMLTDDASLSMPPLPFVYEGSAAAGQFLRAISFSGGERRFRLVATRANQQPAFGCYVRDPHSPIAHAHALIVLTLAGDKVAGIVSFLGCGVMPVFGLPRTLGD